MVVGLVIAPRLGYRSARRKNQRLGPWLAACERRRLVLGRGPEQEVRRANVSSSHLQVDRVKTTSAARFAAWYELFPRSMSDDRSCHFRLTRATAPSTT
jgi:hypothetical protein